MSVVFAAFTPHSPLLLPSIGKEKTAALQKTRHALATIEQNLYLAKPHTIAIISPHVGLHDDAYVVNGDTTLNARLSEFGDMNTHFAWSGTPPLAAQITSLAEQRRVPVRLVSGQTVDHGCAVPLSFLTTHLSSIKILPIGFSNRSREDHFLFGAFLREAFLESGKRVAVIASGDLSHAITPHSPADFSPEGKLFDTELRQYLSSKEIKKILAIDKTAQKKATECGYRSLLILLGIIQDMPYHFEEYAYEAPFGVGYCTGEFLW
ncbi:MAG TPA: AmmeMemoRadiSam system protein B [Candidatus Magasanikbacteria bacterium]|nr:MAG: AmmeMemoRadiSam system protein B [Candidatus Magasanikbacteria bacterium RIFCSPLOWO2_02_FULL_47_16]OGH79894.1 MAG: AmmeMemoRadiSam system protein B [Candidatus Magasanikbacteria bacterium RIFCSPHIGHO2_02_FULL_48_18]OGH82366.1 MAG: AmmeMemoRadiSam system protein B [Candidatus Magasanikbacteria bacterium RIFCSPLOWO2_12_FULL_47_9b]HAZ28633.1 AmmeMemoRadiSam system protein B [Candidatus Magasanikbacteria bacterium]